jgi:hypothetical protein
MPSSFDGRHTDVEPTSLQARPASQGESVSQTCTQLASLASPDAV